jgi:hypothetical protein
MTVYIWCEDSQISIVSGSFVVSEIPLVAFVASGVDVTHSENIACVAAGAKITPLIRRINLESVSEGQAWPSKMHPLIIAQDFCYVQVHY